MAITAVEYAIFAELKKLPLLPPHPSLLELGEANWYGDVPLERLCDDICGLPDYRANQIELLESLIESVRSQRPEMPWEIARIFYRVFLDCHEMQAIDFGGTEKALRLDLNQPISLGKKFDIVFNGGTSEHIFNIWQFFKTVHEHTSNGGLMIHGAAFTGWIDHGFFNFNPTFYWDLAAANGYIIEQLIYTELTPLKLIHILQREQLAEMLKDGQIGTNSNLYIIFRKPSTDCEFATPQQGYYANTVSKQVKESWISLR